MSFVPAYLNAVLRFLIQFERQDGSIIVPLAGSYSMSFYRAQGEPAVFTLTTAVDGGLTVEPDGIKLDKQLGLITGVQARRYNWQLMRGAEWQATGELEIGHEGSVSPRFRVFKVWDGALAKAVAPSNQGIQGIAGPYTNISIGTVVTGAAGLPAQVNVTGDPGNKQFNFVVPRGEAGRDGLASSADLLAGQQALNSLPKNLLAHRATILDFKSEGFVNIDEGAKKSMSRIENAPGINIQNTSGGRRVTRQRKMQSVGLNGMRYTHDFAGKPLGAVFEPSRAYLNTRSQKNVADLPYIGMPVVDTMVPGEDGNWVQFNGISFAYSHEQNFVAGNDYWISAEIIMDDATAPLVGLNIASVDFSLVIGFELVPVANINVSGPLAGGKYIVSGWVTAATNGSRGSGVAVYPVQTRRGFKLGAVSTGQGQAAAIPSNYFSLTTLVFHAGVAEATTPPSQSGSWIRFFTGASYAYSQVVSFVAGSDYWMSVEIIMDDGTAPVVGASSSGSVDLSLIIGFELVPVANISISNPLAGGKYIVSGWVTADTSGSRGCGVVTYLTQTRRGFKVGAVNVGHGRVASLYPFDNFSALTNSRAANSLVMPLQDFTLKEFTIACELTVHPLSITGQFQSVCILGDTGTNYTWLYLQPDTTNLVFGSVFNGLQFFVLKALVAQKKYRIAISVSEAAGRVDMAIKGDGDSVEYLFDLLRVPKYVPPQFSNLEISKAFGAFGFDGVISHLSLLERAWTGLERTEFVEMS